jgi:hypothetical protein
MFVIITPMLHNSDNLEEYIFKVVKFYEKSIVININNLNIHYA